MASPGTSDWRGPIEITWRDSVHMPCIPIHCTSMDGWFVLKSIAHGCKCPIELYVPIDVGRKFSWLMKTCSEFSLHLRDAINTNISYLEIFVVLLEVAVKLFTRTWFRILISVRLCFWEISPCYRSFDRNANWRVKDSIQDRKIECTVLLITGFSISTLSHLYG